MIITIGFTSDDKRVLHKSFSGADITVQLKQPCDILNPVFRLEYNSELVNANYVYCSDFGRYYFITNVNLLPGKIIEINCAVDVLMSYGDQIANLRCVVSRQEHSGITLVPDTNIVLQNYNPVDVYNFTKHFDVSFGSYILQVIGGK